MDARYDYMTVVADPSQVGPRGAVLGWMVVAGDEVIYRDPDKQCCYGFIDGCRWERGRRKVGA